MEGPYRFFTLVDFVFLISLVFVRSRLFLQAIVMNPCYNLFSWSKTY